VAYQRLFQEQPFVIDTLSQNLGLTRRPFDFHTIHSLPLSRLAQRPHTSQSRHIGYKGRMGICYPKLLVDKDLEGNYLVFFEVVSRYPFGDLVRPQ
jgi:hypothetical protein